MSRAFLSILLVAGFHATLPTAFAQATDPPSGDDPRTAAAFLQGLRDRGYFDLATEYLERLKSQPDAPEELIASYDYEIGRMLLDEATQTGDLVRRRDLLDQARTRLDAFTKASPNHPKAPDANIELARLLVERGHMAIVQADEIDDPKEKETKIAEARTTFDKAKEAYSAAETFLIAAFDKFPKFLPNTDPRYPVREKTHNSLMQAQLQKAVVDYEKGQTYPLDSPQRVELMSQASSAFETIYQKYRSQFAGISARMWQGKCYEERGELGKAMGIYNELLAHADPNLAGLQRYVGYFRIIVFGKRKEYPLAADEAQRWLDDNKDKQIRRSSEGLGVQLELAKNLLAQIPGTPAEQAKAKGIKKITDLLTEVVRYPSRYKSEALALLRQDKPKTAANLTEIGKLDSESAMTQSEESISTQDWASAAALLQQAIRRAEMLKDVEKINYARYHLAFVYYSDKRFYESAVLAEHLARRYPRASLASKAAEIAIAAYSRTYNPNSGRKDDPDLKRLIETAKYTAETFVETEQGDKAQLILGQIYQGRGEYAKAIPFYNAVRLKSPLWPESQTRLGSVHWRQSQVYKKEGKTAEANAEVGKAIEVLQTALQVRKDAGTADNDPAVVNNVCDLADIDLATEKPLDAIKRLQPMLKSNPPSSDPAFGRLIATMIRARIAANQVEQAMYDMRTLEKAGGGSNATQLYYALGKLLEKEMDNLKKKGDQARLKKIQEAYQTFLVNLLKSKSDQTFDSLLWAGESLLTLGKPSEANGVFQNLIKTYGSDPKFLAMPEAPSRLLRVKLRLSASYRGMREFAQAEALIKTLVEENPKAIEPLMERGMLIEDRALAKQAEWTDASAQWKKIAQRFGAAKTKPQAYYEAWYHAALAMNYAQKPKEAKQMLASVMRLSSGVGGPEMKQKYKELIDKIK